MVLESKLEKAYTLQEVADLLQVTRRTVYSYVKEGKIKAVKIGRTWRVNESELAKLLAQDVSR